MSYKITSALDRKVIVDGLGPVGPGETVVTDQAAESFRALRGVPLTKAKLPKGIKASRVEPLPKPKASAEPEKES